MSGRTIPDTMDAWYTRCPACGLCGPAHAAEYGVTGEGAVDWSAPARLCCGACGDWHSANVNDLLTPDVQHACRGCGRQTPVPTVAAEVICLSCHRYALGPAAVRDRAVAERLTPSDSGMISNFAPDGWSPPAERGDSAGGDVRR